MMNNVAKSGTVAWNDLSAFVPLERGLERISKAGRKSMNRNQNRWNENWNERPHEGGMERSTFLWGFGGFFRNTIAARNNG